MCYVCFLSFFFSSRRRHTRCALVTGVQTCALPIFNDHFIQQDVDELNAVVQALKRTLATLPPDIAPAELNQRFANAVSGHHNAEYQIGRASCRERVLSVRVDLGGRRIIKKKIYIKKNNKTIRK